MHHMKKYFTEGLIQFTILLSLIGVRVDVDTYLNGYFSPLIETDGGPSSAFIQTPFHHYRDTAAGHQVHPKCPELDYYFTSARLLNEVRALGSPARFPTRLSAWLVHLVPDDGSETHELSGDSGNEEVNTENPQDEVENESSAEEDSGLTVARDNTVSRPGELSKEDTSLKQETEEESGHEENSLNSLSQLTQSSALEQEDLLGSSALPPPLSGLEPPQQWQDFISEFDDFDSLVSQRISDLEVDLPNPISYDVSLQDAMVTRGDSSRSRPTSSRASFFRLESTNSSHLDPQSSAGALPSSLFSMSANSSHNETSPSQVGGYLDEAVFAHINMLDLGDLDTVDPQLLGSMQGDMDTPWVEDSDSGLSLESRSAASPSTSSDSFCEDEAGATGYSSEVESLSSKAGACSSAYRDWSPVNLSDNIWHDHTYSLPQAQNSTSAGWVPPLKSIKQEVKSEDEEEPEEMTRDERRLQALGLPYSAFQIVNMPVEDFLELLDRQDLSGSEVSLLRDVRRRGKNKLAAQNCRKRKLDAILGLQDEVEGLAAQRDALLRQRAHTAKALSAAAERFETLSRSVLSHIRDEYGQPLSSEHYALHCSANGRVVVHPRASTSSRTTVTGSKTVKRKKDKKP